ncbi:sensory rhodopsin transducer [Stenotrophomonas maltophilia]|uniref:sensory rhodopsin transducer n=1 Tax=Stenotrophomonas maltophilia TaxID=40324 RepID=UPI002E765AAE|nr:sensory rhodopsin transducer [Stenotrophomonas maltophilia]
MRPPPTVPPRSPARLAPAPPPPAPGFATLVESDQPIIVQHKRLDSRQPANSIMTTIAHPL